MANLSGGKIAGGIFGLAVIGLIAAAVSGVFNPSFKDNGIDVNNTACDAIPAARQAVAAELQQRKDAAQTTLNAEKEAASDAFWAENRRHRSHKSGGAYVSV